MPDVICEPVLRAPKLLMANGALTDFHWFTCAQNVPIESASVVTKPHRSNVTFPNNSECFLGFTEKKGTWRERPGTLKTIRNPMLYPFELRALVVKPV
jgi:hypothetical protein